MISEYYTERMEIESVQEIDVHLRREQQDSIDASIVFLEKWREKQSVIVMHSRGFIFNSLDCW